MALETLKQKLATLPGARPQGGEVSPYQPVVPYRPLSLSAPSFASPQTDFSYAQSTPQVALPGPTTSDAIQKLKEGLKKFFYEPTTTRAPFTLPSENINIETRGLLPGIAARGVEDIVGAIPRLGIFLMDIVPPSSGGSFGIEKTTKLPPFLSNLYGSDTYDNVNADISARLHNGDGALSAYTGAISEKVLDVAFGAAVLASGFRVLAGVLEKGGEPAVIEAWKTLGSPKNAAEQKSSYRSLSRQFDPDKLGGDSAAKAIINNANDILTKEGIPVSGRVARAEAARRAEQLGRETKLLRDLENPDIAMRPAPQGQRVGFLELPGYRAEPGQAPAFGLSTRRVERVGGAEGEQYFRSKTQNGVQAFEKVATRDAMAAEIGKGIDAFVVKEAAGYAVIEGKTGMQIGTTEKTMAEAVVSAKAEIAEMGEGELDTMLDGAELSPRYQEAAESETVTDPHDVQEIRNSIQEGQNILARGTDTLGNPLTPERRFAIRRAVMNSQAKIGEGLKIREGYTVEDVTPPGFGPGSADLTDAQPEIRPEVSKLKKKLKLETAAELPVKSGENAYSFGSRRTSEIFDTSGGQKNIGETDYQIGDFGRSSQQRKAEIKGDRFPDTELADTLAHTELVRKASDDATSYRSDNIAHIAVMPSGEVRAVYTRINKASKEEVINWHTISSKKYLDSLLSFGTPDGNRTRNLLVRTESLNPLSFKGTDSLAETVAEVKRRDGGGAQNNRGTKDIDRLIRMLDRERTSLREALAHPEQHAKAYGPDKVDEYRRKIKSLTKRIEEDAKPPRQAAAKEAKEAAERVYTPLEQRIEEFSLEISFVQEALDNNPAKELSKYVATRGDFKGGLPEVLGEGKGIFKNKGDQLAEQLGFKDSEDAREKYQEYLLQKKRFFVLQNNLRVLRELNTEMRLEGKDVKSLRSFLDKNARHTEEELAALVSRNKTPETREMIEKRKELASLRQQRLLAALTKTETSLGQESLGQQAGRAQTSAEGMTPTDRSNLTLEEFEEMTAASSLSRIVIDASTPVKEKVNLLDYLRTPDRVLKKIGLSNTAASVRHAYESYLAELPMHIDLVTSWAERVPAKSSNTRIFRWLDGKRSIRFSDQRGDLRYLTPQELTVAKEVRAYLKDWADRLGLPDDNKITHYITHIFEIGELQKEFDEEVAKIIKDIVPGSVYDPFLEKRLGRKGYLEDTWAALDAYVKRAVRKANMDPVLERLKDAATRMEDSQATYVKKYAKAINMQPTEVDNLLDNLIKTVAGYRFGQRPTAYISRFLRQNVYRSMLGLNVTSAVRNLTQGVNTFAVLGGRNTLKGYMDLIMRGRDGELEASGILQQDFIQDRTLSSTRKKIEKLDKGLFVLFDLAEKINRGAAYYAGKNRALKLGASEFEAVKYAKKIVRDTQFQFASIDTPVGLNSDLMKLLTQFLTFGVKQTEFAAEQILEKNWGSIIRYILGSLFLTYGVGQAFDIKGRDFIPGYTFLRYGTPPALAFPLSIVKAAVNAPDRLGNPTSLSDKALDIFSNIPFPAAIQLRKTYRNFNEKEKPIAVPEGKGKKSPALERLERLKKPAGTTSGAMNRLKRLTPINY